MFRFMGWLSGIIAAGGLLWMIGGTLALTATYNDNIRVQNTQVAQRTLSARGQPTPTFDLFRVPPPPMREEVDGLSRALGSAFFISSGLPVFVGFGLLSLLFSLGAAQVDTTSVLRELLKLQAQATFAAEDRHDYHKEPIQPLPQYPTEKISSLVQSKRTREDRSPS